MSESLTCENNGQGEWKFLMLKTPQRKGTRRGQVHTQHGKGHPALIRLWHPQRETGVVRRFLWEGKTQRAPNGGRKASTFPKAVKTMCSLSLGIFFVWPYSLTSNSVACLVFRDICWSWRRIRTWIGRKHIGNQGQCTVSFAILIWLFANISWALDHRRKLG